MKYTGSVFQTCFTRKLRAAPNWRSPALRASGVCLKESVENHIILNNDIFTWMGLDPLLAVPLKNQELFFEKAGFAHITTSDSRPDSAR
jgi:hypothetical protein